MHAAAHRFIVAVPMMIILGCATPGKPAVMKADLRIEQLPDAGFAVEDKGAVSIAYQMSVRNQSTAVITLRKIEMRISRGPYTLRKEPATMNEAIEPGAVGSVTFTMWSYPQAQRSSAREMVWVNGIAYFDSETGSFTIPFTQSFREP